MDVLLLTGYHGTSAENAKSILKSGKFLLSSGTKEWLGTGIYFYREFEDAYDWARGNPGGGEVLHIIAEVDRDRYLDIDSPGGKLLCGKMLDIIQRDFTYVVKGTAQENQCAVMNYIWSYCKNIDVLSAEFPVEKTKTPLLSDFRRRRREFCLRDNSLIKSIQLIEKGDLK